VPDPVMFQRFLDATDYWFGYSDNSSTGSYDPAWECCVVITNDQANAANVAEAGDGEVPPVPGTGPRQGSGPSTPPSSPPRGVDVNVQQALARELEAKLTEEYRAVRLLRASITGEASASETKARCRCDTATGHAIPLVDRGAKLAPRGASAHRASGRSTG
jgi:hypothetical protein